MCGIELKTKLIIYHVEIDYFDKNGMRTLKTTSLNFRRGWLIATLQVSSDSSEKRFCSLFILSSFRGQIFRPD